MAADPEAAVVTMEPEAARGHGHHDPGLAHHFDSIEQQTEATTLGMWIFLATEIMFFGGAMAAYAVYRTMYPVGWAAGSHELNITWGAVNTAVLICSSLTMALAVREAQAGSRRGVMAFLVLTILFGSAFLGIKAIEYADKFQHHHVPGPHFSFAGPLTNQVQMFFSFYFVLTGLHALHMVVGVGILLVVLFQASRATFTRRFKTRVDVVGLYWHFVDIVWIFLFPLLYLYERHVR